MPRRAATHGSRTYVPSTGQEAQIEDFARVLRDAGLHSPRPALVAADGTRLEVPDEIYDALRQVADALSNGLGVHVAPLDAMLTTQQAADYLGVSRPTLVRLLERGEIAMHKPGRHRLVRLDELVKFVERRESDRKAALDGMVAEAVVDGLYDRTDAVSPPTR